MPAIDVPAWIRSAVLLSEVPASPREALRRERLQALRRELAAARRARPVLLPPSTDDGGGDDGGLIDVAHSASNAVPFTTGGASCGIGAAAVGARAEEARQVLPWLYCVEGRLDLSAMEGLASQLALSGLQLLDITRYLSASSAAPGGHWHSGWGSHVRWAGPQALPSPAVAAAAALRRMELRWGGALRALPELEGRVVIVAFHPQQRQLAAETLALYLHVYHGISGEEAAEAAGAATGSSPVQATMRGYLEELAVIADGWSRRVNLAWPYAGGHVEVVGEAVGGWEQRAPMVFDVQLKRWKLQIWGLPPGTHRFKYLVDGCWVIDLAGSTETDSRGNINNVVAVSAAGKPLLRLRSQSGSDSALSASSDEDEGAAAGGPAAGVGGMMATAEPPVAVAVDQVEVPQPWTNTEDLASLAAWGAAVLAFNTRLGLQLRHARH